MDEQPHSTWAEVYDIAYQASFGDFHERFTAETIELITGMIATPARIVDFGAGTGRLSVPLSALNYTVTAVEPCAQMLAHLREKDPHRSIRTFCSKMENFRAEGEFDMALCVFTVMLYWLDENSLRNSLTAAYQSLSPNGILLLDIPPKTMFNSYSKHNSRFQRKVSVTHLKNSLYTYREELMLTSEDGVSQSYQDEFQIRHWPEQQVIELLGEIGFVDAQNLTPHFYGAGSNYYRFTKPDLQAIT